MAPSPALVASMTRRRGSKLYGLANLTSANYFATASGGGEAGLSTGFGQIRLFLPKRYRDSQNLALGARRAASPASGYQSYLLTDSTIAFYAWDSSNAPQQAKAKLNPIDYGRVHAAVFQHTGSQLRVVLDRFASVGTQAITGYAPASAVAQMLGINMSIDWSTDDILQIAEADFRGVPTDAQLNTLFDLIRQKGDIPTSAEWGFALTHRHSLREALLASGSVVDGQVAPASIPDSVTSASADTYGRIGSPVVREFDASAMDGRKTYGVIGFSTGNDLATAAGAGPRGSATFTIATRLQVAALDTVVENLVTCLDGSYGGYDIARQTASIVMRAVDSSGALVSAPTITLTAADVGIPLYLVMQVSGGYLRSFIARAGVLVEQGSGTPISGFKAASAAEPFRVGRGGYATTYPATGMTWRGTVAGNVAPTLAALQQWINDSERLGSLQAFTGAANLYDPTLDIAISGPDLGMTSQVVDRIGTAHLTRNGTDLRVSRRTDRAWPYETTPCLYGVRNWSSANWLSVVTSLCSTSVPYWLGFGVHIHAKAGGTYQIIGSKASLNGAQGVNFYGALTFGQLQFTHGNGSSPVSLTYTVQDSDIGKSLLFGVQWTGSVLQGFCKRARFGSDVPATSFTPYSGAMTLGRHSADATSNPASDNITLLGVMGGINMNLTLFEWMSAHDAFVAEEDLIAIPGKTSRLWSEKRVQNGTLQAIADAQGSGETFAITGAPALSPIYHRAMAA